MKFTFEPNWCLYDEIWFQKGGRYVCTHWIPGHDSIYPGFFYTFLKAEKTEEAFYRIIFYFEDEDVLEQVYISSEVPLLDVPLFVDDAYNLEPVYSQYFVKVETEEQEKKLKEEYRDVRQRRLENFRRLGKKWFVEGKKYLYYREICGPGIFVNEMKVGQIYTNEKSYLNSQFFFGYTSEGEPQSVQYDWNNVPDWEAFFKEIKE